MPPRFQNVGIGLALLRLVEEVGLRNDADELSGAIDNRQPADPIALEKADRLFECRLRRCGDDPSRHHVAHCDHGPIVAIANAVGLGRCAPLAWDYRPPTPGPRSFRSGLTKSPPCSGSSGPSLEGRKPVVITAAPLFTELMSRPNAPNKKSSSSRGL